MIVELYISGQDHPITHDAYIEQSGFLHAIRPDETMPDLLQIVLENGAKCPSAGQRDILRLMQTAGVFDEAYLFIEHPALNGFYRYMITVVD